MELALALWIKIGSLPIRYLGMPLISGKLSQNEFLPLIDKITLRISSWGVEFLSFASRLQLIQFVLLSLSNFWCNHFILPKK